MDIPRVAGSLDELIADASDREPLRPSGARFERLRIDGRGVSLTANSQRR